MMEMSGAIVRLSDDDLAWIRARAAGAEDETPATRLDAWFSPENNDAYVLEKSWAAIHYLLTGTTEAGAGALNFIGNPAFGLAVELGHARPTRFIGPKAVAAIADAIEGLAAPDVVARLHDPELASVEPFVGVPLEDDHKEWLLAVLQGLMTFMRFAANDGVPVLVAPFAPEPAPLLN